MTLAAITLLIIAGALRSRLGRLILAHGLIIASDVFANGADRVITNLEKESCR